MLLSGNAGGAADGGWNPSRLWQAAEPGSVPAAGYEAHIQPDHYRTFTLAGALLQDVLGAAPAEGAPGASSSAVVVELPRPDASFGQFLVVESPVMAPELAAKFPEIKTYVGQGVDDPAAHVRLDVTPAGFHAQVLSPDGAFYIDPYYHLNDSLYLCYYTADLKGSAAEREALAGDALEVPAGGPVLAARGGESGKSGGGGFDSGGPELAANSGAELRTYRAAIAATGEYTAYHGGTVGLGQAAIVTAINRINGVYETELTIRLELVADNDLLVYTDGTADPYTNNNSSALLTENQANTDIVIGAANYDIGHVFNTGTYGGLATVAGVGYDPRKARGTSGTPNPTGDSFHVEIVAHEMGHQFGARHTFNGDSGSCTSSNWFGSSAYEPGSGSTIMSYSGSCGDDNIVTYSDPYFHSISFDQIINYVDVIRPNAGTRTNTGNSVPTVSAGADYTIPASTPFELVASGTDADGDPLVYHWEERDLGPQQDVSAPDNGSSPLFRSWPATTDPTRVFPRLSDLLNNTTVIGEKLPTTTRTMNFRAVVRDQRAGGGGVNTDEMALTVVNTGSGFAVTAPNTAVTWTGGTSQTVTWDVAGTTANGINTASVDILLSTDGGLTYLATLVTTANDGSHEITVPNIDTTTARIKIKGSGNVFFDVSNSNFTIAANPGLPGVTVTESGGSTRPIEGAAVDSYTLALNTAPAGTVTMLVAADGQTEVSTDGFNFAAMQTLVFNSTAAQTVTVRAIDDGIEEGPHTGLITHRITASTSSGYPVGMLINSVVAHVLDDDLPPVIGVDFDYSTTAPAYWSRVNYLSTDSTNITRDDGVATGVDLDMTAPGSVSTSTVGLSSVHVPRHIPSLLNLGGFSNSNGTQTITATWKELTPGQLYGVYVFGFERRTGDYSQTVSISGATTLPSFTQTLTDGVLQVNDEVGTSTRTLQSFEHAVAANGSGSIVVTLTPATGSAGVSLAGLAIREIPADTQPPTVANVNSTTADGAYKAGTVIPVTITFSEPVTVTGTPQLTLETGVTDRAASHAGGSGTATLTFRYTVQAGDASDDLDYASTAALGTNGGTIRDAAGNDAVLALPAPGAAGSLGANKALVIDTLNPVVTVNALTTNDTTPAITGTISDGTLQVLVHGETYTAGDGNLSVSGTDWTLEIPGGDALPRGTYDVAATAADAAGNVGSDSSAEELRIVRLIVTSLTPTSSGFVAQFSGEFQLAGLNLYDGAGGTLGPADVILKDGTGQTVAGSMVVADNHQAIEFIKTGGVLAADTYTVTMRSGATAFRALDDDPLDGNKDGTTGDDFTGQFTVTSSADRVISVPDVAHGAGQPLNVSNGAAGLPIRLSRADGVTSLAVDLVYDEELLEITAATLAAGLPGDWSVANPPDTSTPGVAKIRAFGTTALSGTSVDVVRLTAAVPNGAAYGAVQAIRLEIVSLKGGTIVAVGDVAVHKAVYLGDADGSGIHSSADALLTVQAALGLASGFAAHSWTDPRIVGDADGSGALSAADAFLIVQEGLGLSEPFVPDNPDIAVRPVGGGVDPQFQIEANLPATVGGVVTVPVKLDIEEQATNVGAFDFDVFFDPAQLTIQLPDRVSAGTDTAAWARNVVLLAPGHLRVGMVSAAGRPLAVGLREIARLQFRVAASLRDVVPLTEGTAHGDANPVSERPGHVVALDIEPVDPRAGGYVWTAVDGSVAVAHLCTPAILAADGELRANVAEERLAGGLRDGLFAREAAGFSPLEAVLAELADEVGSAWH